MSRDRFAALHRHISGNATTEDRTTVRLQLADGENETSQELRRIANRCRRGFRVRHELQTAATTIQSASPANWWRHAEPYLAVVVLMGFGVLLMSPGTGTRKCLADVPCPLRYVPRAHREATIITLPRTAERLISVRGAARITGPVTTDRARQERAVRDRFRFVVFGDAYSTPDLFVVDTDHLLSEPEVSDDWVRFYGRAEFGDEAVRIITRKRQAGDTFVAGVMTFKIVGRTRSVDAYVPFLGIRSTSGAKGNNWDTAVRDLFAGNHDFVFAVRNKEGRSIVYEHPRPGRMDANAPMEQWRQAWTDPQRKRIVQIEAGGFAAYIVLEDGRIYYRNDKLWVMMDPSLERKRIAVSKDGETVAIANEKGKIFTHYRPWVNPRQSAANEVMRALLLERAKVERVWIGGSFRDKQWLVVLSTRGTLYASKRTDGVHWAKPIKLAERLGAISIAAFQSHLYLCELTKQGRPVTRIEYLGGRRSIKVPPAKTRRLVACESVTWHWRFAVPIFFDDGNKVAAWQDGKLITLTKSPSVLQVYSSGRHVFMKAREKGRVGFWRLNQAWGGKKASNNAPYALPQKPGKEQLQPLR